MASRTDRDKNKIKKMLKVTKSANRSVLDDASSKTDTALTLDGPEQPDEDDYGYTSNAASALYKSLMDKYNSAPEDKMFSKSMGSNKNADLMSTKDRVRAAILREKEEEKLGRKRTHSTISSGHNDGSSSSLNEQKHRQSSKRNLYDPKSEREAEERRKKEQEQERRQKMKNKRPPPPLMDFQKLLKLAEEKQHEPIKVEVPQKFKEPERLLTSKEKKEMEMRKAELEERERRRNGTQSKPHVNSDTRKPEPQNTNGRIPKLSSANSSSTKPLSTSSTLDKRKQGATPMKDPIRSAPSTSFKTPSKLQSSSNGSKNTLPKQANSSHVNTKKPTDLKSKGQAHDVQRSSSKPSTVSKQSKPIDSRNIKPREFPPRDVVKPKEFPPRDMIKSREFPPRDMIKSRGFPPRDVHRGSIKPKQSEAHKRRIFDDDDEEDSEYDSEMDDFIDDDLEENDYSSEIRNIFGYDKSRYRDDDDDVDNMESSFAQQQREEFVSKKIGLMEDLEDMRMEEEEKKRKAKRRRH